VLEVRGEAVVLIEEWLPDDPYPQALVREPEPLPVFADEMDPGPLLDDAALRVRRARALLAEHGGGPALEPGLALDGGGDAEVAAWQLCGVAPVNAYDAQRLLAADGAAERLALLVELMDDLELDLRRMLIAEPGESGEPGGSVEPGE
jgi:Lon protease-like protein